MNLVVSIFYDKDGRRTIRYHNLVREFLINQLRSRVDADELNSLYIKAGNLFEKRSDFENAIKFYLRAKAYSAAAPAIGRVGMRLVQLNRMSDLSNWLKALPSSIVEENPWLLYYRSITVRFMEPKDNIQRLSKALTLFTELGDIGGQLLALGLLIESSFFAGEDLIPMDQLIEKSEVLLESIGTDQHIFEKAALLLALGLVYPLRAWNATKGCWANHNAYLILKQLGIVPLQIYALSNLFHSQMMLGNIPDAEITRQKMAQFLKKHDHPELRAMYSIHLGQFFTFKGDLERAQQHLRSAKMDAEELGLLYLYTPLLIQELMLLPHLGQFEKTEQVGEQLLQFASTTNNLFSKGCALLNLGASHYHKGDYVKAMDLVDSSMAIFLSKNSYSLTHIVTARYLLVLINIHLNRSENILTELNDELNKVMIVNEQTGGGLWATHYHFAQALLYRRINQTDRTVDHLRKGMKAIEQDECFHLQWMSRRDFTKVCLLTVELKVDKAIDYAEYLLVAHLGSTASPGLERLMHHSDKTIRRKVFTMRKKIYRSTLPHIKLQTLAGFEVFKDNEPMESGEWQRKHLKTLLKIIVARGSKNIPRDCIIEELWPEVSSDAGDKRFKVALHRLRKSLEPGMDKEFGSSYIHLTDNLVSLDDDLCTVDVDLFTSLVRKGSIDKKAGKLREAAKSFQEAVDMYKDDFLAQDLYSDWAKQRRTELHNQYIKILLELGRIYEDRGAVFKAISCYKKAIESDPLLESAYQQLIVLYSAKGKTNQALQTYEKLKQALQTEIQSEPEPFSKKLYEKLILNS
jgi:DNA-binding SARP family transcriptional activator